MRTHFVWKIWGGILAVCMQCSIVQMLTAQNVWIPENVDTTYNVPNKILPPLSPDDLFVGPIWQEIKISENVPQTDGPQQYQADTTLATTVITNDSLWLEDSLSQCEEEVSPTAAKLRHIKRTEYHTILFYLIIWTVLLLALVRINHKEYIRSIYKAFFNYNSSKIFFADYKRRFPTGFWLLMLLNSVFVAILLYEIVAIKHIINNLENTLYYLILCWAFVIVFLLFRFYSFRLMARILPQGETLLFNFYHVNVIESVLVQVFFPFLVLFVFWHDELYQWIHYLAIAMLIAWIVYRLRRAWQISAAIILQNKFYIFLYLCSVEIGPVLISLKFFKEILQTL
ncbi:MAG: DUF4271 domain-containing protein [Chitinophagales bacterium]|nr:DUF4271 domain-containing protein [Chitinophagales bacterium]